MKITASEKKMVKAMVVFMRDNNRLVGYFGTEIANTMKNIIGYMADEKWLAIVDLANVEAEKLHN